MVKQGDIIKINFNPTKGHEQQGYRPALVVSNDFFNKITNLVILCPITNTITGYPLNVKLDDSNKVTGEILCSQIKSLDINNRGYKIVDSVNEDILHKVLEIISLELKPL